MDRASVGIVVVTWRAIETTRACMQALTTLDDWPIPTLIVDSASGTSEGAVLAREFGPPFEAIELPANGGVALGYNAGLEWAAARGMSHVLLLNNDVSVADRRLLPSLLAAAGPGVAAVGPKVLDSDGSIFSLGGRFDPVTGVTGHLIRTIGGPDDPYDVAWVDGSCLLVSIAAAQEVGGLSTDYFMYWEETDWCVRARRGGYRCVVAPSASVIHQRGSARPSPSVVNLLRRNAILFMRRNGGRIQNLTSIVYFSTLGLIWETYAAWRRGEQPGLVVAATARALAWNGRDALSRRSWRRPADGPAIGSKTSS